MKKTDGILDENWKVLVPTRRRKLLRYEVSITKNNIALGREIVQEAFSVKTGIVRVWLCILYNRQKNALKFRKVSEKDLNAYSFRQVAKGNAFMVGMNSPFTKGVYPTKITKEKEILVTGVGFDENIPHSEK